VKSRYQLGQLRRIVRRLLHALDRGDYEQAATELQRLEELLAR
jgi:hypothetical protein